MDIKQTESLNIKIKEEYKKSTLERIIYIGRISTGFAIPILTYFILQDNMIADFPSDVYYWRIPPLLCALLFFLISFIPLKQNEKVIKTIYNLYLFFAMVMMCGITVLLIDQKFYESSISALIVIIFAIFISSVGGIRFLLPIYLIPMTFLIFYLAIFNNPSKDQWLPLTNPIVAIIISLVLAKGYERLHYREFKATKLSEFNNKIIEDNNIRRNKDLNLARQIQEKFVPSPPTSINGTNFYALYKPMEEVGGDLYDFIFLKESKLVGIFISDVSGHGVSAALITGMVKTLINTAGKNRLLPAKFLEYINTNISGQLAGNFLTAFYGIVDTENKILHFARAGHNFPFLIRDNKVKKLKSSGALLGVMSDINIVEQEIQLQKGDKIIFYTDGLTETINLEKVEFEQVLSNDILINNSHLPVNKYVSFIYDSLVAFNGNDIFKDDICIIGLEIQE